MKKRILSLVLAVVLVFLSTSPVYAKDENTHYYLELLNMPGRGFDFMVPSDMSTVFIRADQVADWMDLSGHDFDYVESEDVCVIKCDEFKYTLVYNFYSDEVVLYTNVFKYNYEAPGESFTEWGYAWIPFEFTMRLLNIHYLIFPSGIEVYIPQPNQMMVLSYLRSSKDISFDWIKELGYSETDMKLMTGSSRVVNFFGDLLSGDFLSRWHDVASSFTGKNVGTDRKVSVYVAELFANPSVDEVEQLGGKTFEISLDILGSVIDTLEPIVDITGFLEKEATSCAELARCVEKLFEEFPALISNRELMSTYTFLKNNSLAELSDLNLAVKNISLASNALATIKYSLGLANYVKSFDNKSKEAAYAIKRYAEILDNHTSSAIIQYANAIDSKYSIGKAVIYIKDNVGNIVKDFIPLGKLVAAPELLLLIGWDIARNSIPYLKNTFESTEKFEIAKYAVAHQKNAFNLFKSEQDNLRKLYNLEDVDREALDDYLTLAYAYLKFSVVARNAANASLQVSEGISDNTKKSINTNLSSTNKRISRLLSCLEDPKRLYLPEDVYSAESEWLTEDIIRTLDKKAVKFVTLNDDDDDTTTSPYYEDEITTEYIPYEDAITEEEAIAMVKEVMCQSAYVEMLFDAMFSEIYTFEVVDIFEVEEYSIDAYVISMVINGTPDYYHMFVPVDGSAVWIGWIEESGEYYCFTDIDMYNMSVSEVLLTFGELMLEAQMSDYY